MTEQADICQSCPLPKSKKKSVFKNKRPSVTPGKKIQKPPPKRSPACNVANSSADTTGGTNVPNGTNTTTKETEPCIGPRGPDGWGFKWESKWASGKQYYKQSAAHVLASTVEHNNSTWVCIQDHTSSNDNQPPGGATIEWRGDWTLGEVYTAFDDTHKMSSVEYFGAKYVCIETHISESGLEPDVDTVHWAEAGEGTLGQGVEFWELMAKEASSSGGIGSLPKPQLDILDQLKQYADDIWDWAENADLEDWLTAAAVAGGVLWAGNAIVDALTPDESTVNAPINVLTGEPTMPGTGVSDGTSDPLDPNDPDNWSGPAKKPDGVPNPADPSDPDNPENQPDGQPNPDNPFDPDNPGNQPDGQPDPNNPNDPDNENNQPDGQPDPNNPSDPDNPENEGEDVWTGPITDANGDPYVPPNSLKGAVTGLCNYAGIQFDASDLPLVKCEFSIASNTQIRSVLEQLAAAYQFDMIDSGGILKFVMRNTDVKATIELSDMGFSASDDSPTPYTAKRFQGITLPKSVSLTYISPDLDYNNYTQKSEIVSFDEGQDINLSVPIVMGHAKAKKICETTIVNAHLERMNYKFTTTYKFINLEPGDVIQSPMGLIRIIKVEEIEEGILEFEATDAGGDSALQLSGLGVQLPSTSNNVEKVATMTGSFFLDPNNIDDSDQGIRIYCAVHGFTKPSWPGAAIYMSTDSGESYKQIANTKVSSTLGLVEAITPYTNYKVWDETTEIIVKHCTGTLISKSEIAVLNGANKATVGQEIIGFCNAELIGEATYKLSKLLRGRQGTEVFGPDHVVNELFCLWNDAPVRLEFSDSDRGTTKMFKVLSIGEDLSNVEPISVQIMSNNNRMWAVHGVTWNFVGADIKVNWQERVRFDNQLKDFSTANHDPDWGGYAIAILDSNNNKKSTHTTTSTEFIYTNAMQVADFGQLMPNVKMSILQMSTKFGGGLPVTINT